MADVGVEAMTAVVGRDNLGHIDGGAHEFRWRSRQRQPRLRLRTTVAIGFMATSVTSERTPFRMKRSTSPSASFPKTHFPSSKWRGAESRTLYRHHRVDRKSLMSCFRSSGSEQRSCWMDGASAWVRNGSTLATEAPEEPSGSRKRDLEFSRSQKCAFERTLAPARGCAPLGTDRFTRSPQ